MGKRKLLRLHYDTALLKRARAGSHNFSNRLRYAFQSCGYDVDICPDNKLERLKTQTLGALSITDASKPLPTRSLVMRKAYVGAFWRLEHTQKRWDFEVSQTPFRPEEVDPVLADQFITRWQSRLFKDAPSKARRSGFVLVPLQAKLLDRRSFQAMAPIQMLDAICRNGPDKPIVATLHPGVKYSRAELSGLERVCDRHKNLSISKSPSDAFLRSCDVVACQNSAVAFDAFFFRKPVVLFAKIDFHHIAANVLEHGAKEAFRRANEDQPDFARYLYWFLKLNSIGAGQENAEEQILTLVGKRGWVV